MFITGTRSNPVVMDILPWPDGYGFKGGDNWWQYTLSQSERDRMDDLLGLALLDKDICEQLVVKRDVSLLEAFGLSEDTQQWFLHIKATTLKELAQGVLDASTAFQNEATPEAAWT